MKKTMTIILLSVAVIALGGRIVWQQQTIEKAEKTHQRRKQNERSEALAVNIRSNRYEA
nr:hypothetical protein [Bacillus pumilus]